MNSQSQQPGAETVSPERKSTPAPGGTALASDLQPRSSRGQSQERKGPTQSPQDVVAWGEAELGGEPWVDRPCQSWLSAFCLEPQFPCSWGCGGSCVSSAVLRTKEKPWAGNRDHGPTQARAPLGLSMAGGLPLWRKAAQMQSLRGGELLPPEGSGGCPRSVALGLCP